jgi:tetratricopeptide (TPR) repeat protein
MDTTTPTLRAGVQVEEFKMKGKAGADGFTSKLAEMAEKARRQTTQQDASIRLDAIAQDFGLPPADPVAGLIREAKKHAAAKQYAEAINVLSRALKQSPGHHEALYLAAFCFAASKDYIKALKLLLPLREARLEGGQEARVEVLRAEIRQRLFAVVVLKNLEALASGQHGESIAQLRELVKADPDMGVYHFLLTGTLMAAGRIEEALEAAENGLRVCPAEDRAQLVELRRQVQNQHIAKLLEPARRLFRKKDYRRAQAELARVPQTYQEAPLYVTFDGYLDRLEGGGGVLGLLGLRKSGPETVDPPGTPGDADALYFFLVGPDLRQGQAQMNAGQPDAALATLLGALKHAPRFPFANYLAAGCIHLRFFHTIAVGKPMDLSATLTELSRAREYARVGARDPEIQDAQALLQVIEATLRQLRQVEEQSRAARQEAALVNPVIEEFMAIMKLAEGGIRSAKDFDEIKGRLKALRDRVPPVRRKVTSAQGTQAMNDLSAAVESNWKQLLSLEPEIRESATVEQHVTSFNTMMELLQQGGGITTRQQFEAARGFFRQMKTSVEADRKRLRDPEGRNTLDKLLEAIRNVLRQFGD